MKASYLDVLALAQNYGSAQVNLSAFTYTLLLCMLDDNPAATFIHWSQLTEIEQHEAKDAYELAIAELMVETTGVEIMPLGMVVPFSGVAAPAKWLFCDGALHLAADYPDYFAIVDPAFKNILNGENVFHTPYLTGRFPLGEAVGTYDIADQDGEAAHILTTAEMPSHDHPRNANLHTDEVYVRSAAGGSSAYAAGTHPIATVGVTGLRGASEAHNNMPPYTVLRYIVRVEL